MKFEGYYILASHNCFGFNENQIPDNGFWAQIQQTEHRQKIWNCHPHQTPADKGAKVHLIRMNRYNKLSSFSRVLELNSCSSIYIKLGFTKR